MKHVLTSPAAGLVLATEPASAQGYQVYCAILLSLAGGWPASAPCVHTRAIVIRTITPWPVEPPLQIWRCPIGAPFNAPALYRRSSDSTILPSAPGQKPASRMQQFRSCWCRPMGVQISTSLEAPSTAFGVRVRAIAWRRALRSRLGQPTPRNDKPTADPGCWEARSHWRDSRPRMIRKGQFDANALNAFQ